MKLIKTKILRTKNYIENIVYNEVIAKHYRRGGYTITEIMRDDIHQPITSVKSDVTIQIIHISKTVIFVPHI